MRKLVLLTFFLAACPAQKPPQQPQPKADATLSGNVHAVGTPCDPATPPAAGCDGPAVDYEVVVLAKDAKTAVGKTKTDAAGAYTIALPAGEYTVLTPAGMHGETKRNDIALTSGATAQLDLQLDTGIR